MKTLILLLSLVSLNTFAHNECNEKLVENLLDQLPTEEVLTSRPEIKYIGDGMFDIETQIEGSEGEYTQMWEAAIFGNCEIIYVVRISAE